MKKEKVFSESLYTPQSSLLDGLDQACLFKENQDRYPRLLDLLIIRKLFTILLLFSLFSTAFAQVKQPDKTTNPFQLSLNFDVMPLWNFASPDNNEGSGWFPINTLPLTLKGEYIFENDIAVHLSLGIAPIYHRVLGDKWRLETENLNTGQPIFLPNPDVRNQHYFYVRPVLDLGVAKYYARRERSAKFFSFGSTIMGRRSRVKDPSYHNGKSAVLFTGAWGGEWQLAPQSDFSLRYQAGLTYQAQPLVSEGSTGFGPSLSLGIRYSLF